ncbi:hypothetical protein BT96DRAFT_762637, partial [Gymnopus androsaceus JB14]
NSEQEKDDLEGFIEVLDEMLDAERDEWKKAVHPLCSALEGNCCRCISFKIINSPTLLLPRWHETVTGTNFKDHILPCDVSTWWNSIFDML